MYFISEDMRTSPFGLLFNSAYPSQRLLFSGGNTLLEDKVLELVSERENDFFVIYLDVVPDNVRLADLYNKLLGLSVRLGLNLVVVPIPCSEYAFIKSVYELDGVLHSTVGLDSVLKKSTSYKDDALSKSLSGPPRNFEKFCKRFCRMSLKHGCCAVDGNSVDGQKYFLGDCACSDCETRLTLHEKAVRYVSQLHIVPASSDFTDGFNSWNDVIRFSWQFVDEYNAWAEAFSIDSRLLARFPLKRM